MTAERVAEARVIHLDERARVLVHLALRHAPELRWPARIGDGVMQLDAFAGRLFVFANRRKDRT